MSAEKLREASVLWHKTYALYQTQLRTSAQLFSHPDATDAQILEVARSVGRTRAMLVETRHQLLSHKDAGWRTTATLEELRL